MRAERKQTPLERRPPSAKAPAPRPRISDAKRAATTQLIADISSMFDPNSRCDAQEAILMEIAKKLEAFLEKYPESEDVLRSDIRMPKLRRWCDLYMKEYLKGRRTPTVAVPTPSRGVALPHRPPPLRVPPHPLKPSSQSVGPAPQDLGKWVAEFLEINTADEGEAFVGRMGSLSPSEQDELLRRLSSQAVDTVIQRQIINRLQMMVATREEGRFIGPKILFETWLEGLGNKAPVMERLLSCYGFTHARKVSGAELDCCFLGLATVVLEDPVLCQRLLKHIQENRIIIHSDQTQEAITTLLTNPNPLSLCSAPVDLDQSNANIRLLTGYIRDSLRERYIHLQEQDEAYTAHVERLSRPGEDVGEGEATDIQTLGYILGDSIGALAVYDSVEGEAVTQTSERSNPRHPILLFHQDHYHVLYPSAPS